MLTKHEQQYILHVLKYDYGNKPNLKKTRAK